MLVGQPNNGLQLCFPISLQARVSGIIFYDLKLSIDEVVGTWLVTYIWPVPLGLNCWISSAPV